MIDYATWHQIHTLHHQQGLRAAQIARQLDLHPETVARHLAEKTFRPRRPARRASKLDPHKAEILRLLEAHALSSAQLLRHLRERGYTGGASILRAYVARVRPVARKAFLALHFAPGECAQVDWGHAGTIQVGNTRRHLSFFVMVLCHSRMMYVEFTLAQHLEHFLACHQNAFAYFGGVPGAVMIDNLRSAVLAHPRGGPVTYHPRYLDFARHHGFAVRACNVRAAHEKGRVERAVGYVRTSFLQGRAPAAFAALAPDTRLWLDTVANVRLHAETRRRPRDLFQEAERAALRPLGLAPYDPATVRPVTASSQFRVTLDTNRYSVPAEYAGRRLTLRLTPDRVALFHEHLPVAEHPRCYERGRDLLVEGHQCELLQQRRRARDQQALARLLRLTDKAADFARGVGQRRPNPDTHLRRVAALADQYGDDALRRALEDAVELEAFSADLVANLLEQRGRLLPEPGPLHLTRNGDLLDLELPPPDLSVYHQP